MTKRDRVLAALAHEHVTPVPWQLNLSEDISKRLRKELGYDVYLNSGSHLACATNESYTKISETHVMDMYGVTWNREQEGDFGVVEHYLLNEPNLGGYVFPVPDEEQVRRKCVGLEKQTDKFRVYVMGFSLFERAWALRSMLEILVDFIENKSFVHSLFEKIIEYNTSVIDIVAKHDIDCILFGDDWGQQKGLIMGAPIWREFIKPYLRRMYDQVKSYGMFVALHSCGDISEIFNDLVELKLDIYNTFQPEIYDIEEMKSKYGSDVTFYGGISTQRLLPVCTPEVVRRETKRIINIVGRNGGYVCAPTHAMPNDIPTENVLAFLDAVQNQ